MLKKFRPNRLFIFLCLAIASLFVFVSKPIELFFPANPFGREILTINEHIRFSEQGNSQDAIVELYNKDFDLYYSTNGGETFIRSKTDVLNIDDLRNPEIIYQNTSIRWRHPRGNLPFLKNVVVKVVDPITNYQTDEKVLSYIDFPHSELPIISLTVKQGDLFDWNDGIMVYGDASTKSSSFHENWWYMPANFKERGYKSERNVYFEFFEGGKLMVEQACKIRISGNATRYFPQKSIRIHPVDPRTEDKIKYPFWGKDGNKKSESLVLRNSGNDNTKTLFADLFIHQVARNTNVLIQNGYPVSVFINGNYWGIYNLRERIDSYYIAKKENVKAKQITILDSDAKGINLKDGKEHHFLQFDSLIKSLKPLEYMDNDEYARIKTIISTKSFIDYILIECFFANQDWPANNVTWYKAEDSKWKWILNDVDFSMAYPGADNVNVDMFQKIKKNRSATAQLFNALMQSQEFKEKFKERGKEMLSSTLSKAFLEETFNNVKNQYKLDIDFQIGRWKSIESRKDWELNCENNKDFLMNRIAIFEQHLNDL